MDDMLLGFVAKGNDILYYDTSISKPIRPTWDHNPYESALSQVPKMFVESERYREMLASSVFYHALDVGPKAPVRLPQTMTPAVMPGRNGEELVSCLYYMRETDPDRFESVTDVLSAGFPSFEKLGFPPVAAGTLAMTWKDRGYSQPFYVHQLSEGTLRFLWLVTLLYSPGLPKVTLIDEPEVSLHPELLAILAEVMREAGMRTQLLVATHSDRLVRHLTPGEVVAMDIGDDGGATARRGDSFDLEKWLRDYSLDELWSMGIIGGRSR